MKPSRLLAAALAAPCLLLLIRPSAPAHSYSSGAPPGFSGPEQYCNACHSNPHPDSNLVNSGTGFVTIIAPDVFEPGVPIPITVAIYNTTPTNGPAPRQGFEFSARDADLEPVGLFIVDGTTAQYTFDNDDFVTHTATSNMDTSWTFGWRPPFSGAPPTVTFYAAGNATDGDFTGFGDNDDKIYSDSVTIALVTASEPEAPSLAFRLEAPFPNPLAAGATAVVRYALFRPAEVTARLLDGRGRVVRVLERGSRPAGAHTLRVGGEGLAPGAYFLSLSTPEGTQVLPMTVVP